MKRLMALFWALATPVLAQESAADFAWQAELRLAEGGPWHRLELPLPALLAARHNDLRDLRVVNGAGQFLAYSLLQPQAEYREAERQHGVRWFPLQGEADTTAGVPGLRIQSDAAGTLVEVQPAGEAPPTEQRRGWLLDASAIRAPLVRLELDWQGEDGFQRFALEASDDLQHWRTAGEYQVTRLSFSGDRIEQREVQLPSLEARYLRLLWQSPRQAPLLSAVKLTSVEGGTERPEWLWSEPLAATPAGADQYQWQLPRALPLQAVRVPLEEQNLLLPVRLQGRADSTRPWQALAQGMLYRLPQEGRETRQEELALSAWPVSQLRLQLDARGGGLPQAPRLQYALAPQTLVFLARGEGPFRLLLGDAQAQSQALSPATLIPGYRREQLASLPRAELQLPAASSSSTSTEQGASGGTPGWQRVALWGVLLAGVLLLAGMAWSLLRGGGKA